MESQTYSFYGDLLPPAFKFVQCFISVTSSPEIIVLFWPLWFSYRSLVGANANVMMQYNYALMTTKKEKERDHRWL